MGDKFYPQQRGGCCCSWDVLLPLEKRNKSEKKLPGPTHDGTVFPDEKWRVKCGPWRWRWGCVLHHLQLCYQDRAAGAGENTYFFICLQTPSPQFSQIQTQYLLTKYSKPTHLHIYPVRQFWSLFYCTIFIFWYIIFEFKIFRVLCKTKSLDIEKLWLYKTVFRFSAWLRLEQK